MSAKLEIQGFLSKIYTTIHPWVGEGIKMVIKFNKNR